MSHKVVTVADRFEYEGKLHYNCQTTRLHTNTDLEGGKITMGVTHFLPNGYADIRPAAFEMVYTCLLGKIAIQIRDEGVETEYILNAGDSIRMMPGCERGCRVIGPDYCDLQVVIVNE